MEAQNAPFDATLDYCPMCDAATRVIKLGSEPAREICPSLKCRFDGVTLE